MGKDPPEPTLPESDGLEALHLDARLRRLAGPPPDVDVEAALQRVKSRFHDANVYDISAERQYRIRSWRRPLLRTAAAVLVVLGAAVLWRFANDADQPTAPRVAAQTFETSVGQADSLTLPDGTAVVLAPGSRLVLRAGYGDRAREVELDGEALFDVKHDAARSFSVHAAAAVIRDLGTAFTVQAGEDQTVRVAVTAGSVVLHTAGNQESQGVVIRAGDRGSLSADGAVSLDPRSVSEADLAWLEGRLVFDDASLATVADVLRRWYGIELKVADQALAQRHVTASFKGESVAQVLEVIALTLGARVERNGKTAVLRTDR